MFLRTPTTAIELRLVLYEMLGSHLGTFEDGQPAIWVEDPPAPPNGVGLHCLIYYRPRQLRPSTGLTQSIQYLAWQVTLIQFDRSVDGIETLSAAGDKIRNSFHACSEFPSASVSDRYPVLAFSIPFTKIVNP